MARDRTPSRSPYTPARSTLVALPPRVRTREARVASPRPNVPRGVVRGPLVQTTIVLILAVLLSRYAGFPPGVAGSSVAGLAAGWAARRRSDCQLSWLAISLGCLSWAAASVVSHIWLVTGILEFGGFVFAIGLAAAQLCWPELRGSIQRLVATVTDAVTVLATLALWGVGGMFAVGASFAVQSVSVTGRLADLLLPIVTSLVVAPQLSRARRWCAFGIAAGLLPLFAAEALASRTGGDLNVGAVLLEALAFVVIIGSIVIGQADGPALNLLDHDRNRPPFLLPGLIGAAGLVLALVEPARGGPIAPAFAILVGACLAVREVLRVTNRREAYDRLASSLDLEGQLLTMQAGSSDAVVPDETLDRSCSLAAEVLKASATLAWLVDSDAMVLRSVGGASAPDGLLRCDCPLRNPALSPPVYCARANGRCVTLEILARESIGS